MKRRCDVLEHEHHQKEIEGIQCPAEIGGEYDIFLTFGPLHPVLLKVERPDSSPGARPRAPILTAGAAVVEVLRSASIQRRFGRNFDARPATGASERRIYAESTLARVSDARAQPAGAQGRGAPRRP